MICYIPARAGSKRIKNKNIKRLFGKPVIVHTINQIKKLKFIKQIYVSTDSEKIKKILSKYKIETLDLRKKELSKDKTNFIQLIRHDIDRYAKKNNSNEILFVLPTSALVSKKSYENAYKKYITYKPEVLMSVVETNPFFAMIKKGKYLKTMFKNLVLKRTQKLKKSYIDAGSFYFFNLKNIKKYNSLKNVKKLIHHELDFFENVDVDTPKDWEILKFKFKHKKK